MRRNRSTSILAMLLRFIPMRLRTKQGSLLLETLLSVAILATGLTVMIQVMTSSLRAMAYSARYSQMAAVLENEMAEMIFLKLTGEGLPETDDDGRVQEAYEIRSTSRPIDDVDREHLRDYALTVSWKARRKNHKVTVHTYLSEGFRL